MRARVLIAGFDYSFGSDKKTASDLADYFDGQVEVISPVLDQGEKISSTRIRQAVLEGRVHEAARLLGHPLSSRGIVVHGDARGRTIGYPTANLAPIDRTYLPSDGVYVVDVDFKGQTYRGMASVGKNVTFDGKELRFDFVGQTVNNSVIKNNLTLVNQFTGYKFDGRTANDKFVNFSGNYENEGNVGTSTRERTAVNFDGKIDIATESEVKTERFYRETLGWSNDVWDFNKVSAGGLPKLKNSDLNDNLSTEDINYIETVDEFITKITENPYGKFVLNNDIDLSSKNSLINVEFRGILDGNNHKITGNTVSIFNNINKAIITNLVIENSVIKNSADNIGALSKTMYNSTIENVHVTGAAINGANKIGGLAGYAESSKIKQSSSNASILANGSNAGGLIGQIMKSTIIENSYSSGKVNGNENIGGLVGQMPSRDVIGY